MPRTRVIGWTTGTGPNAAVAVQAGRAAEQDLVVIPEPHPHPDQRAWLGSDDGSSARQPPTREGGQERDQHLHEQGEPAVPATHAAGCAGQQDAVGRPFDPFAREHGRVQPNQPRRAGPRHVPRPCVERRLPLVERQVAVGAHIGREQAVVAMAVGAMKDQNPPE